VRERIIVAFLIAATATAAAKPRTRKEAPMPEGPVPCLDIQLAWNGHPVRAARPEENAPDVEPQPGEHPPFRAMRLSPLRLDRRGPPITILTEPNIPLEAGQLAATLRLISCEPPRSGPSRPAGRRAGKLTRQVRFVEPLPTWRELHVATLTAGGAAAYTFSLGPYPGWRDGAPEIAIVIGSRKGEEDLRLVLTRIPNQAFTFEWAYPGPPDWGPAP
jgi:hypothetical protein